MNRLGVLGSGDGDHFKECSGGVSEDSRRLVVIESKNKGGFTDCCFAFRTDNRGVFFEGWLVVLFFIKLGRGRGGLFLLLAVNGVGSSCVICQALHYLFYFIVELLCIARKHDYCGACRPMGLMAMEGVFLQLLLIRPQWLDLVVLEHSEGT